jgi:hypothetical protein
MSRRNSLHSATPLKPFGLGDQLAAGIPAKPADSYAQTLASLMRSYPTPAPTQINEFMSLSQFKPTIASFGALPPPRTPQQRLADLLYTSSSPARDGFTVDMSAAYRDLGL